MNYCKTRGIPHSPIVMCITDTFLQQNSPGWKRWAAGGFGICTSRVQIWRTNFKFLVRIFEKVQIFATSRKLKSQKSWNFVFLSCRLRIEFIWKNHPGARWAVGDVDIGAPHVLNLLNIVLTNFWKLQNFENSENFSTITNFRKIWQKLFNHSTVLCNADKFVSKNHPAGHVEQLVALAFAHPVSKFVDPIFWYEFSKVSKFSKSRK